MPYFHGTFRDRLPAILRDGLGAQDLGPNSEECERGVYLAVDPRLSLAVLQIHMLNWMFCDEESSRLAATPSEEMDRWVIILVDDARIDPKRLRPDPHVTRWKGSFIYDGVIDVTGAVTLDVRDILSADAAGALPDADDDSWRGF